MAAERLQKIIAQAGFASRREAEELIRDGFVTINGVLVTELGTKADASQDHVKVRGKLITKPEEHRYLLMNKPREVMTTLSDPEGRSTVVDFLRGVKERVYPVGRLDYQSEGLLLLTNDGDFAQRIAHPSNNVVKTYNVKVRGVPEEKILGKLQRGITIEGRRTLPCEIHRLRTTGAKDDEGNSWFEIKLHEGRTQQIRKMFQAVGHPVNRLRRVAIGALKDHRLKPGEWRELEAREIKLLLRNEPEKKVLERKLSERKPRDRKPTERKGSSSKTAARSRALAPRKRSGKGPAAPARSTRRRDGS